MATSHETFEQMKELIENMTVNSVKWEAGNKSAAAKMRKDSSALDKLCKVFRKESIAECKA